MLAGAAGAEESAPAAGPPPSPADAQKILRVATSGDYAPFSFEASPGGAEALDGFDVEVARLFARDRGYRMEVVRFRWPDLSKELAAGSFDVAMSGVTVRPERSIAGRLSVPVAATQAVAITWKGSGVPTLADLDRPGRRIAVNAGGHLEKVAHGYFRRADVLPIADNAAVRMALLDRTADAVITDNFEEKVWTASAPDAVRLGTLSDDRKAYLLPAANAELAAELDRWLLAREADGTLAGLRRRYFRNSDGSEVTSGDETIATAEPVAALAAAVRERVALMPLVYEAKKADGKAIEDKAREVAVLDGAVGAVTAEAAAVGRNAPDAEAVRALFDVLIAVGKDVQQKIADTEARQRPGTIRKRPGSAAESQGGAKTAGEPTAAGSATAAEESADTGAAYATAAEDPDAEAVPRRTGPDLARDLRPAIGRITDKIARILVAMTEPVPVRGARSKLEASLASQGVRAERLDEMAEAVSRVSSTRK